MPHRSYRKRTAGFTLAELLIVVAIVLVLVAIAVPVFTGATARAQEATCAGNRHTVKVIVADSYLLDTSITVDTTYVHEVAEKLADQNNGNELCPSGGTYSLKGDASKGIIIIQCSKHGISADDEMYSWITDNYSENWTDYWGTDRSVWKKYVEKTGITEWPSVEATDGTTYYLKFKGYTNNPNHAFLYAGMQKDLDKDDWQSRYLCDSAGIYGTAGQWYELPQVVGLTTIKTDQDFCDVLATGKKVTFESGKFVAN